MVGNVRLSAAIMMLGRQKNKAIMRTISPPTSLSQAVCNAVMALLLLLLVMSPALAARVSNPVVVFSGLDKITGRITTFEVMIGETYQFGGLQVTPRVCYSSSENEASRSDGFVEVDEVTLDKQIRRIFTGWMFADSPGLNAVEHAVYDVWLKGCSQEKSSPS